MSSATMKMAVDGRWVDCLPTDEYGVLGVRYTCDLRNDDGKPAKRLLIRRRVLPAAGDSAAQLVLSKSSEGRRFSLRAAAAKTYQEAANRDGKTVGDSCKVLQQDLTGLTPLGRAVLQAVKAGDSARVWTLFYSACEALREFGKSAGEGKLVPLQCPPSLAVASDGSVVLLDAEIRAAGSLPDDSHTRRAYAAWFGAAGVGGFAHDAPASLLHSRAVLAYFLNLLKQAAQVATPAARAVQAKVATKLEQVPADMDLADLEGWVRNNVEDWSLPLDEESPPVAEFAPARGARRQRPPAKAFDVELVGQPPASPRKKRSLLLRLSLIVNLVLIVALILAWLLWPKPATGNAAGDGLTAGDAGALTFSSYSVVFPTQGTISEKVDASLADLFPGKAVEIKRDSDERRRLLKQKLDESVKSLKDPENLKKLLLGLSSQHSVRFKGFVASEPSETLPALVERGGVFTIAGGTREQYGSLLQADGLDRLLKQSGMDAQQEPRDLLQSLKSAVADYASLEDALNIINDRTAYLLRVEPTPAGHEAVRKKLLGRDDKPVFISRPIPELFDAVDPTADTGGGSAAYTLQLDRKCFWRLAGADDRKNVDYTNNTSNDRMKWKAFEGGRPISWKPIPLTRKSGKTEAVATFDIAVVMSKKVVVFRNQSILVGDKREDVMKQGQTYIARVLHLPIQAQEDAISVRQQDQQFTGTLVYSFLAEQVKAGNASEDLQVLDLDEFATKRTGEDDF
jgi:hypothetical protein